MKIDTDKPRQLQNSEEAPSIGSHRATIADWMQLTEDSFVVKFEFDELDSKGKKKFIWQEFSKDEVLELNKEIETSKQSEN